MAPKAHRIFETVLYGSDLALIEQFYCAVLGLEVIDRAEENLAFRCGDGVLLVFRPDVASRPGRGVPSHGTIGPGHVAFATPAAELDAWREQLRKHGVAIEKEVNWHSGGHSIYVRDPAGNSVEFAPSTIWGGGWNF